jgi:nitrous oxidase accessory protein NosD
MTKVEALILVLLVSMSSSTIILLAEAGPSIIIVPDDYQSISVAVEYAKVGDTVFVKKGTYEEHTLMINKSIALVGEVANGTIIKNIDNPTYVHDGHTLPPKTAVVQINANSVKVSGLTLVVTSTYGGHEVIGATDESEISNNIMKSSDGIQLTGSKLNVKENHVSQIECIGSNNNIASNTLSRASLGIIISGSSNFVLNNNLTDGGYFGGIELTGNRNEVARNRLVNSSGIRIEDGSHNLVHNNRVFYGSGIAMFRGFDNTFHANLIENGGTGAVMGNVQKESDYKNFGPRSANNSAYHNNFMNNEQQVNIEFPSGYNVYDTDSWDNGSEGNYWSDYRGIDVNNDGIGDTPYIIDANRSDRFPLIFPFDIENNKMTLPTPSPSPSTSPSTTPTPTPTPTTSEPHSPSPTPPPTQQSPSQSTPEPNLPPEAIYFGAITVITTVILVAVLSAMKRQRHLSQKGDKDRS